MNTIITTAAQDRATAMSRLDDKQTRQVETLLDCLRSTGLDLFTPDDIQSSCVGTIAQQFAHDLALDIADHLDPEGDQQTGFEWISNEAPEYAYDFI